MICHYSDCSDYSLSLCLLLINMNQHWTHWTSTYLYLLQSCMFMRTFYPSSMLLVYNQRCVSVRVGTHNVQQSVDTGWQYAVLLSEMQGQWGSVGLDFLTEGAQPLCPPISITAHRLSRLLLTQRPDHVRDLILTQRPGHITGNVDETAVFLCDTCPGELPSVLPSPLCLTVWDQLNWSWIRFWSCRSVRFLNVKLCSEILNVYSEDHIAQ